MDRQQPESLIHVTHVYTLLVEGEVCDDKRNPKCQYFMEMFFCLYTHLVGYLKLLQPFMIKSAK